MKVIRLLKEIFKTNKQKADAERKLLKILKGTKRYNVYLSEKQIALLRHLAEIGITDLNQFKQKYQLK